MPNGVIPARIDAALGVGLHRRLDLLLSSVSSTVPLATACVSLVRGCLARSPACNSVVDECRRVRAKEIAPRRQACHVPKQDRLVEKANEMEICGGSAFRGIAGYGRHGVLHEQRSFEPAADLAVEVEFVVTDEETERPLDRIRREDIHIVYAKLPAESGGIEGKD